MRSSGSRAWARRDSGACLHEPAADERGAVIIALAGLEAERAAFVGRIDADPDEPDERRVAQVPRVELVRLRFVLACFLGDRRVKSAVDRIAGRLLVEREVDGAGVERIVEACGARGAARELR